MKKKKNLFVRGLILFKLCCVLLLYSFPLGANTPFYRYFTDLSRTYHRSRLFIPGNYTDTVDTISWSISPSLFDL